MTFAFQNYFPPFFFTLPVISSQMCQYFFICQGTKILQSLMWNLNPRQVFDLSQAGPKEG